MVNIRVETFAKCCIYNLIDKEKMFWLGENLNVKNICHLVDKEIKGKFNTNNPTKQQIRKFKRHGSKLVINAKFIYAHEDIITPIILHCRVSTPKAIEFRSKLGFDQYNIILTKKQSVSISLIDAFEGENMQFQYSVLGYRINLYFHDYKLRLKIDEKSHKDRNIDYEIKSQKSIEKELGCKIIRIIPDGENFNISKVKNKIFRHNKESIKKLSEESTKKSLIDDFSKRLLGLEFKNITPYRQST